ncbi:MAG: serine/threonine-protein phosphatase, partial [Planctomycetes bacterium]|nr:serine/threonine-protein phosphatase [Planctomycetota bacterium]
GLEFAGAGHPSALLVDETQQCRDLKSEGPVLGIGIDFAWITQRERFVPGDRLFLYTDGVTEASGGENNLYGLARLKENLLATRDLPPTQAVEMIVQRLSEFCDTRVFLDDLTLVLVELQTATV